MLIVCPSCATSYTIDPAALGAAGRTVRCARCKVTWLAGGQSAAPEMAEFVDDPTAEAKTQADDGGRREPPQPAGDGAMSPNPDAAAKDQLGTEDDFGEEPVVPIGEIKPELETIDDEAGPSAPGQEVVVDAPSLAPHAGHEHLPNGPVDETDNVDAESYAARRQRLAARRKEKRRSSRWAALVLVLFAINVAVIGGRDEVVRALPQTASFFAAIGLPVNLRHLKFENVKILKDAQDGVSVLIVEGTIASTASKPIAVPRLRFAARDAAGLEIYTWTALPSRSILGPGEHLEFRSRLASPPANARTVMVRFFNAQDASAGAE
jgi:predicted Zn finger-like uncharacterized protein